ncbi:MAG TPA: hypothetical protein DEH10_20520 [Pseudomonas sp.]|nr:hypothetical protein [Pseudomonas sp.]
MLTALSESPFAWIESSRCRAHLRAITALNRASGAWPLRQCSHRPGNALCFNDPFCDHSP